MADHPTTIPGFASVKDAAEYIGNLRYDALHVFLRELEEKLARDSDADADHGRPKLSGLLHRARCHVGEVRLAIGQVWKICEPHMQ